MAAMPKKVLLTGDRPTGPLHIGHYMGSLQKRLELQTTCETYIMIADAQAITDHFDNLEKVRSSVLEVVCDYLAVGLDPSKCSIFIQSQLPQLPELTMYCLNTVSIQRIGHNPTVKAEMKMRGYEESVPAGFYLYPIYQVADIIAFDADYVPVGKDQAPMLELARDVVRHFNAQVGKETLVTPEAIFPHTGKTLPGIDGQKMSKSLGNAIYLADEDDVIAKKVKKMRSDPSRKSLEDGGDPDEAIAFTYLELFHPDQTRVEELKDRYRRGGLPDKTVKDETLEVLINFITPIRQKRKQIAQDKSLIYDTLRQGTAQAQAKAECTLRRVKEAMGLDYSFLGRVVN